MIPREAAPSLIYLHSRIPARHPSVAVLGEERMGVGVAVEPRKVLTAHYLVMGAERIEVVGIDGRPRSVPRVGVDHESGLALLTLEGAELRPARVAEAPGAAPGLPVFLLTCVGPGQRKGATGHVFSVGPFEAFWEYMLDRAIMTTAINPGLAGAPLFDGRGRLLGLVSLGLAAVARYSLAIPIELFLERRALLDGEAGPERQRAWIGFYPQANDGGIVITGVVAGGPADTAGLQKGDFVLTLDGRSVTSLRELYRELWKKGVGERLGFQVLRDSAIHVVDVVAGDRHDFYK